ncbi:rhomboid family intramembrane serine protease [Nocardioides campestrisoli]|uniref:rhomboid family intramembrane serine protease n=1 Tax=Nocardioides campestrisoli TaxID=2736757 RepID=UPI0015E69CB8|nr:rhomboid family intramembrane serine protease [Nocardioides campestrisoli]
MSGWPPASPGPYGERGPSRFDAWWRAGAWSLGFVAVLWLIELFDAATGNRLDVEGIRPGSSDGLAGILLAPLLHAGWGHLVANTVPLLVLGFLVLLSGVGRWAIVTTVVWIVGGLGTWFFGAPGTVHLGASILVFGWLLYLLARGFFTRRPGQIALAVVLFVVYGSMLWGVLPGQPGISWQGHFFGALGGVIAAWGLRYEDRRP